jgi:hypothetical protein
MRQPSLLVRNSKDTASAKIVDGEGIHESAFLQNYPLKQELEEREDTKTDQRLKTFRSWAVSALEAIEEICPVENVRIVDWIHVRLDNLRTPRMEDKSWRDRSSELNQSRVREWLEEQDIKCHHSH